MKLGWDCLAVMVGLMWFGVLYNAFVAWLERRGYHDGYVSLLVVGGTFGTLVGAYFLIGMEAVVRVFVCFAASGTPMVVGSMCRYMRERRLVQEEARRFVEELGKGDS